MDLIQILSPDEKIFFEQAFKKEHKLIGQDLKLLLNNQISFKDNTVDYKIKNDCKNYFTGKFIECICNWEGLKSEGKTIFLISEKNAKLMGNILVGRIREEKKINSEEEISNEEIESFREVANQIIGSSYRALGDSFSFDFHTSMGSVSVLDLSSAEGKTKYFNHEGYIINVLNFMACSRENNSFVHLIPMEIIQQIRNLQQKSISIEIKDEFFKVKRAVLIVDDDDITRGCMNDLLSDMNFSVTESNNGVDAYIKAIDNKYDLILMDIGMPNLNGIDACKKIKTLVKAKNTPVIIVSAMSSEVDVTNAIKAGARDFIVKPVTHKEIVLKLKKLFSASVKTEHISGG